MRFDVAQGSHQAVGQEEDQTKRIGQKKRLIQSAGLRFLVAD